MHQKNQRVMINCLKIFMMKKMIVHMIILFISKINKHQTSKVIIQSKAEKY